MCAGVSEPNEKKREAPPPLFVISQDFELHWGVRDKRSVEAYRENLIGVRTSLPATLALFKEYDIHATWASVGFLFFEGKDDLLANLPSALPAYTTSKYSPYGALAQIGRNEGSDPFHFAPSLLRSISETAGQEVGTHTFSHYYCLEDGQDATSFEADLQAAAKAAKRLGITLRSIVFPRNQVNESYLPICSGLGLRAYRGTPKFAAYSPRNNERNGSWLARGTRLADNYVPLSGHNAFPISSTRSDGICDVPASFFLRPYSHQLAALEPLRLRRILAALTHAAKFGLTYHLWWHPHNFGINRHENLAFLRRILEHVAMLRSIYDMRSVTMTEAAELNHIHRRDTAA